MKVMVIQNTTINAADFDPPLEGEASRYVEAGEIIDIQTTCAHLLYGMSRPRIRYLTVSEIRGAKEPEAATVEASESAVTPKARGRKAT